MRIAIGTSVLIGDVDANDLEDAPNGIRTETLHVIRTYGATGRTGRTAGRPRSCHVIRLRVHLGRRRRDLALCWPDPVGSVVRSLSSGRCTTGVAGRGHAPHR